MENGIAAGRREEKKGIPPPTFSRRGDAQTAGEEEG